MGNYNLTIKFKQGISFTAEQLKELAIFLINEPENGWKLKGESNYKNNVYQLDFIGNYGEYTLKLNLFWELVTVLKVL